MAEEKGMNSGGAGQKTEKEKQSLECRTGRGATLSLTGQKKQQRENQRTKKKHGRERITNQADAVFVERKLRVSDRGGNNK